MKLGIFDHEITENLSYMDKIHQKRLGYGFIAQLKPDRIE